VCTCEVSGSSLLLLGSTCCGSSSSVVAQISPIGSGSDVSLLEVMAKGFWFDGSALTIVLVSQILPAPKPLKFYNQKLKDNRFAKMDDSLIAKAVSAIIASPASPLGFGLSPLPLSSSEIIAKTLPKNIHGLATVSAVV
jgi:hypothetical protein